MAILVQRSWFQRQFCGEFCGEIVNSSSEEEKVEYETRLIVVLESKETL